MVKGNSSRKEPENYKENTKISFSTIENWSLVGSPDEVNETFSETEGPERRLSYHEAANCHASCTSQAQCASRKIYGQL